MGGEVSSMEHRAIGAGFLARGLLLPAKDAFGRWLKAAEAAGDTSQIIAALNGLIAVAYGAGDLEEAVRHLERGLIVSDNPATTPADRFRVYINAINVYSDMGRLAEAKAVAVKAAQVVPDQNPVLAQVYWLNLSKLHWRQHEWNLMQTAADKAHAISLSLGDESATAKALINRGISHLELGAFRLAELDLAGALALREELDSSLIAYSYAELGRLHFLRSQFSEALDAGRNALNALLSGLTVFDKEEVARVSRLFGSIFASSGQRNLALKYLNRAAAYFSQLGLHAEWQRCTDLIGKVLSEPVRAVRSQLQKEIHQLDFLTAVLDLTDDLESVEPFLRGHGERTAALAMMLGEAIGLCAEDLVTLKHAARLSDVGMIAVDHELLHKEGGLSESERKRVAMHTTIGEEMLRPYGLDAAGLAAIRHHHEHYDGSGLPDGLSGKSIPILARVVAVAGTYDSLTSERPYRKALSHSLALGEMQAMAGHKLDPVLVGQFLRLHQIEGGEDR